MSDDLALLERCHDMMHAQILRGLLESNDIPCFLLDEHHSAIAWHITPAIGGMRVMVLQSDLAKAQELIGTSKIEEPTQKSRAFLKKPYLRNIVLGLFGLFSGAPLIWPERGEKE